MYQGTKRIHHLSNIKNSNVKDFLSTNYNYHNNTIGILQRHKVSNKQIGTTNIRATPFLLEIFVSIDKGLLYLTQQI